MIDMVVSVFNPVRLEVYNVSFVCRVWMELCICFLAKVSDCGSQPGQELYFIFLCYRESAAPG